MKKLTIGILAHVDSGKTTLSEAMMYLSGNISRLGRVDHRDSFLDNFRLERLSYSYLATLEFHCVIGIIYAAGAAYLATRLDN